MGMDLCARCSAALIAELFDRSTGWFKGVVRFFLFSVHKPEFRNRLPYRTAHPASDGPLSSRDRLTCDRQQTSVEESVHFSKPSFYVVFFNFVHGCVCVYVFCCSSDDVVQMRSSPALPTHSR